MTKDLLRPDYIFESSWEVCNKVGGIYTVLSTRAKTLQDQYLDRIIFIGPDCWKEQESPYFQEDSSLFTDWKSKAAEEGLTCRIGRWSVPGHPLAILVDFEPLYAQKNEIYAQMWEWFQVDSLHGYGDYDEASMFSYAAGRVVESFYRFYLDKTKRVIYHGNEWMTGMGLLYIRHQVPEIGTLFTTHATSIGRSIAGNNKPLYEYLSAYHGDQMAEELNMQSKHSIEKQTAHHVDCFTTVSEITANECKELLDKPVDEILLNGFEDSFVPRGQELTSKRRRARKRLLEVANALMGNTFDEDAFIVSTSGRYEFRNKGIDVFLEAIHRLRLSQDTLSRKVLIVVEVPAWVGEPRADLMTRLASGKSFDTPLEHPMLTHWLRDMSGDRILQMLEALNIHNAQHDNVKVMFVPCYLTGDDGILNLPYYDLVVGNDLCVYPSYYEPWGYTPLEAIAFKVPCVTTDLAGFGLWVNRTIGTYGEIENGVKVIHRTDNNYSDVADEIKQTIMQLLKLSPKEVNVIRQRAADLSKKALWQRFIKHYETAYHQALSCVENRIIK
ncbi:glycogen/starch synthase [Prevotella sp. BV3P1]|uniref:glycogen/starch synthase n=1 Tax=Prevotella sp. BV3P1 TaxID=1111130 RepID=UPI000402BEC4|nr:glycogen/starch synthase [Prevotella sp. BV3P1]